MKPPGAPGGTPIWSGERAKAVVAAEVLLRMLKHARDCFPDDDLETVVVYLSVLVASTGAYIRDHEFLEEMGTDPLPPSLQKFTRARAISDATGLPRETVRRKLKALVADGRLAEEDDGFRALGDNLSREGNRAFARKLVRELAAAPGRLRRFDRFEPQD